MATYARILAQKISRTEEPGVLQSMGSQRVRQDWVTKEQQYPIAYVHHIFIHHLSGDVQVVSMSWLL